MSQNTINVIGGTKTESLLNKLENMKPQTESFKPVSNNNIGKVLNNQLKKENSTSKTPIRNNAVSTSKVADVTPKKPVDLPLKKVETIKDTRSDSRGDLLKSNNKIKELQNKIDQTKRISIDEMKSDLNEFQLLKPQTSSNQSSLFADVLNKVEKKNNKGMQGLSRNIIDVEGLIKQESLNVSRNLDESMNHDFSLLLERNELEKKLQLQQDNIRRNQKDLFKVKNDMSIVDDYRADFRLIDDDNEDLNTSKVVKMKKDIPSKKSPNINILNSSYQISTAAVTQKPSIINSEGYYNDELFLDGKSMRSTNRMASVKRPSKGVNRIVNNIVRE
jgi:hypothetical protein